MKTICIFTNAFPYGNWEPYLETEIRFYNQFDKVWIFALQIRNEHLKNKRHISKNTTVIPVRYASKIVYLLHSVRVLFDYNLYIELGQLISKKRFNMINLINMFVYFSRSHYEAGVIARKMKNQKLDDVVLYSYRFEYQPYVAMLLKKKWKLNCKIVARAHRYDLYEEEHAGNYIPMRKSILNALDFVYPCSDHGTDYILNHYPKYKDKVVTRFLGTIDHGIKEYEWHDSAFRIVTCSNVVKVKQLDKLICALELINGVPIKWTHYGDGILINDVKKLATEKLGGNIQYEFKGSVDNPTLLKEYEKQNYYLFVNVSSSEGIPVSIMEASSVGIPCIATNVGGTSEIIEDGVNGILINHNISNQELANAIINFCNLDQKTYLNFRTEARKLWDEKYNAKKNYMGFMNDLKDF